MAAKVIVLTVSEWAHLKGIVAQGERVERALGIPVEVINGDTKIEINEDAVTISLAHES